MLLFKNKFLLINNSENTPLAVRVSMTRQIYKGDAVLQHFKLPKDVDAATLVSYRNKSKEKTNVETSGQS